MTLNIPPAPEDFDAFWAAAMTELAALPIAAELTLSPLRTTDFSTLYEARLTSVGPYRLFAHYSVPLGDGPFPVIFHAPGYGSVVHIASYEERQQFVTIALRHRGQRLADQPFAAAYPGLLTTGIDTAESYVYRGIVADCCRAVDFLLSRPEVDGSRIAIVGNELALFAAALRPQVSALCCTPGLFHAARQLAPRTGAYPLEEFNDYARAYPDRAAAMAHTLGYFEPTYFAPRVQAETMFVSGAEGDLFAPQSIAPLSGAFARPPELVETAYSSYQDGVRLAQWICDKFGMDAPVLPPHWR